MKYLFSMLFWLNWMLLTWAVLYGRIPENASTVGLLITWLGFLVLAFIYTPREVYGERKRDNSDN